MHREEYISANQFITCNFTLLKIVITLMKRRLKKFQVRKQVSLFELFAHVEKADFWPHMLGGVFTEFAFILKIIVKL